ncbi:MAG TPA: DNA primase small subunit domain-containing protein [Actinomycetota bacterium]|nr:DNA primase small subunit domain-containing protein [Actinomycetota bacterium]
MATKAETLDVAGRDIRVTNPDKLYFPDAPDGPITKLDLVRYWVEVADTALVGCRDRPTTLHRFPDGAAGEGFYQKRLPKGAPPWVETALITFPSGRTANMPVMADAAHLAWAATLGCLEINPWPVRSGDVDHPDELRMDLDPMPGVPFEQVREVAMAAKDVLEEHGLVGFPKTSGKKGIHVNVRIRPEWDFTDVRKAALALAREVERRLPDIATTKWWKEERHGVFLDYNQNARDRTVASAYSVRPVPDARVSTPLEWDEVPGVEPDAFTLRTVPDRLQRLGDPGAEIDDHVGTLEPALERSERQAREGQGEAPYPPHFPKAKGEPVRAQPSRRRKGSGAKGPAEKGSVPPPAPGKTSGPTGRRRTRMPLIEVARAASEREAMEGLERWKAKYPEVVPHLEPTDIMVDPMRGRSTTWTRIRVNLRHVPEAERPSQEALEVDHDPWEGVRWPQEPSSPQEGGDSPS